MARIRPCILPDSWLPFSVCVCVKYCAVLLISLAGGILVASSVYKFLAGTTSDGVAVE